MLAADASIRAVDSGFVERRPWTAGGMARRVRFEGLAGLVRHSGARGIRCQCRTGSRKQAQSYARNDRSNDSLHDDRLRRREHVPDPSHGVTAVALRRSGYVGATATDSTYRFPDIMCIISLPCVEASRPWATAASVGRALARAAMPAFEAADRVKVQRHLRKLSRSLAAQRGPAVAGAKAGKTFRPVKVVANKHGTASAEMFTRKVRRSQTDNKTGEVIIRRRTVVGFYQGGSGFLSVNDGRVTADSIARILGGNPAGHKSSYDLVS